MNSYCVVISDHVLKQEGTYKIKLICETNGGGHFNIGLIQENLKDTSNYWGSEPNCCITCSHRLDAINMKLEKGSWPGTHFAQTKALYININIANNIYRIYDEAGNNVVNTTFQLNGGNWRFFLNNFSGNPYQWILSECSYS